MSKVQGRDALEARARKIVEALGGAWSRSKGMCCCPAHADRTPSLSANAAAANDLQEMSRILERRASRSGIFAIQ